MARRAPAVELRVEATYVLGLVLHTYDERMVLHEYSRYNSGISIRSSESVTSVPGVGYHIECSAVGRGYLRLYHTLIVFDKAHCSVDVGVRLVDSTAVHISSAHRAAAAGDRVALGRVVPPHA